MSDHLKGKWMEPFSFMVLFFLSVKPYNQKKYLGTLLVTTHKLLHLNQHQSSHGEHLVDSIGDTSWWCDLLFADLLRSLKLDSWIGPISTYQHWSVPLQCVAYWVQPRLAVKGQTLDSSWMGRWYIHTACWWMVALPLTTSYLSSGPLSHWVGIVKQKVLSACGKGAPGL